MKENEVSTIKYELLDSTLRGQLKKTYNSIEKNMLKSAELCFKLAQQSEDEFLSFAKNELGMSKGTISKFITAGRIIVNSPIELPSNYTSVYELHKVSDDIEGFADYYSSVYEEELKVGSQRKIHSAILAYTEDETTTETETETETATETETETETEHDLEDEFREMIKSMYRDIQSLTNNDEVCHYDEFLRLRENVIKIYNTLY